MEDRIIRAYIELKFRPADENGEKSAILVRRGRYDVRLVEPVQNFLSDTCLFCLELFDRGAKLSLVSGHADDLGDALLLAKKLISRAESLSLV
jgi:hypothetical protein